MSRRDARHRQALTCAATALVRAQEIGMGDDQLGDMLLALAHRIAAEEAAGRGRTPAEWLEQLAADLDTAANQALAAEGGRP